MTTWIEVLVLLLRGSADVQTAQEQPIIGTPCDVPLPRTITSMFWGHDWAIAASWHPKKSAPAFRTGRS
jgi:hypothetical protein